MIRYPVLSQGSSIITGDAHVVATLAALKALTSPYPNAVITECRTTAGDGGGGTWVFRTGDQSANVTADTQSGVWAAPNSDITGASGAWQRVYVKGVFSTAWFGVPVDWNGTTGTDAGPYFQAAMTYISSINGGILYHMGPSYIGTETTVSPEVALDMCAASVDIPASGNFNTGSDVGGSLHVNGSILLKLGPLAEIRNGYIINSALPAKPTTQASALTAIAAYSGTGVSMGTLTQGATIQNVMIVGFALGVDCQSINGRNTFQRIRGDCTSGMRMQDTIDTDGLTDIEWGNFFAPGISDDSAPLTTTASTAAGNAVLTFGGGVPSTVNVGAPVMDLTVAAVIPSGTTVLSKTATTVTLTANVTGAGVGNGDTIIFGGYKACYRSGTGFLFQDCGDGMAASALTVVGYAIGVDFYGSGAGVGTIYQSRITGLHVDSFYYHVTGLYTTVGVRFRGNIDSCRLIAPTAINSGTGYQTVTGGSINRVTLVAPYTANNGVDFTVAAGAGVQVYGAEMHALMPNTGTRVTVDASAGEARFTDCRLLGTVTTQYTVNSTVLASGLFTWLDCSLNNVPMSNVFPGTQTNDNAVTSSIGELITSSVASGSAVGISSGATTNITSISLGAGDWEVWGTVAIAPTGGTTTSVITGSVSTTSATLGSETNGAYIQLQQSFGANLNQIVPVGRTRLSLASTTTVYLVINCTFAVSSNAAYGFIGARRVR